MHVYIYDSYVNQKKFDTVLARVETRLTDLGLNGKICRLGAMKSIKDIVKNELNRGAKTIIAVGNDHTVSQVINAMAQSAEHEPNQKFFNTTPLGIIPIDEKENKIAAALGIGLDEDACEVLSARRIQKIDLGAANKNYFLSEARINNQHTVLDMNKDYSIEILEGGEIKIINLALNEDEASVAFNPQDGVLELYITTNNKRYFFSGSKKVQKSVLPLKKLTVYNNKNFPLILDNVLQVRLPADITVLKQKLHVIVGKSRKF